ncbi:hypothetical protein V8C37DRAFT_371885 [Trichoderma ceciliae]
MGRIPVAWRGARSVCGHFPATGEEDRIRQVGTHLFESTTYRRARGISSSICFKGKRGGQSPHTRSAARVLGDTSTRTSESSGPDSDTHIPSSLSRTCLVQYKCSVRPGGFPRAILDAAPKSPDFYQSTSTTVLYILLPMSEARLSPRGPRDKIGRHYLVRRISIAKDPCSQRQLAASPTSKNMTRRRREHQRGIGPGQSATHGHPGQPTKPPQSYTCTHIPVLRVLARSQPDTDMALQCCSAVGAAQAWSRSWPK